MYEQVSYETIMDRIRSALPEGLDKREGSLIYTAVAPVAAELQLMYIELDTILKETFAHTASREYLIRRAAERGLAPTKATEAVFRAVATPEGIQIPVGERFSLGTCRFQVMGSHQEGGYLLKAETAGSQPNHLFGYLLPVAAIPGLETMTLAELLIPGEDEEDTESLRARYLSSFHQQSFSGNRQDYLDKVSGIEGVGGVKVTRAKYGGGTVGLTVLDGVYRKASSALIDLVQSVMDPGKTGEGDGLAPIDHVVTVDTVEEKQVEVQLRITFDNGYSYGSLQKQIMDALQDYVQELSKGWADQHHLIVRISQIESRILSIQGIVDVGHTLLCGQAQNLELGEYVIPVLGGVVIDS